MDNDQSQFFAPFRLVAEFSDGSRLLFDGLTEEQARQQVEAAQEQHGDIAWLDRVTDQNYTEGIYYKLLAQPPHISLPIIDLTDIDTTDPETLKKALQDPFIEDGAPD